jgi:septal ring factor EnvC (AmiA/AmiB activator)
MIVSDAVRKQIAALVSAASVLTLNPSIAAPQVNPNDARQLARQAAARITELQTEADRLAQQTRTVLTELRSLEVQRQLKGEELTKASAELKEVLNALDQSAARVLALESERLAETPRVRERLTEIYKRGRAGYLRLLLGADDLRAFGRMTRGVAAVARLDRVRLDAHRQTIRQERAAHADLEKRRQDADAARAAALKARQAVEQAVNAHNRRLDELDRRRDLAAQYIGELQTAQTELLRATANLSSSAAALPIEPFRGSLDWPIVGRIISRFGRTQADQFGTAIVRNGIEIAAAEGAPVRAVHGGTVAYAAPFTGFGTLVIVDHGRNAFTLYGHLTQATVTSGARVGRGETVGRVGRTPAGQLAAYFELRIDGRPVDPVQWLRSAR